MSWKGLTGVETMVRRSNGRNKTIVHDERWCAGKIVAKDSRKGSKLTEELCLGSLVLRDSGEVF